MVAPVGRVWRRERIATIILAEEFAPDGAQAYKQTYFPYMLACL